MNGEDVPTIYESAIQHQDGSRVEVEFNAGLTTYDGRPANLVIVRDIRERVKARQELEASQRLLSLVIDNVPAQVSYVDKHQRYRFVNQRYEEAYGIPPIRICRQTCAGDPRARGLCSRRATHRCGAGG